MKICFFFTILILAVLFFSLSTFAQESVKPKILRSVPSETVRDAKLETAIRSVLDLGYDEKDVRYYYNRVDLNGDKKPEVIVFLFGRPLCGTGGCDALLFQKVRGKYKLVTAFEPARNPIIVSRTKTKGWRDLIFFNIGGGVGVIRNSVIYGYYSLIRFNGRTYSENPTVVSDAPPLKTRFKGVAYVVGEYSSELGLRLRPRK